jgi:hypothetical protein
MKRGERFCAFRERRRSDPGFYIGTTEVEGGGAAGYILTISENADAWDKARAYRIELLSAFDYERQLQLA